MALKKLSASSKTVDFYDVLKKGNVSVPIKDVTFGKKKHKKSNRVMHFAKHKKLYRIISKDDYNMLK